MSPEVVVAIFALLVSIGSLVVAIIARLDSNASARSAERSEKLTEKIHQNEKLLAQRQLIVPLWEYIGSMNEINPQKVIQPDVQRAMNALELVALCCETGAVDKAIIKRTFSEVFIKQYEAIRRCPKMEIFGNRNGDELVKDNKAAMSFYDELIEEYKAQGKPTQQP